MIFLVTGGAGFIGSAFVRYLLSSGSEHKVLVLDALTYAGNPDNISGHLNDHNLLVPDSHRTLGLVGRGPGGEPIDASGPDLDAQRWKRKLDGRHHGTVSLDGLEQEAARLLEGSGALAFVVGNIVDREIVDRLMPLADVVVNFAAETHVDRSILAADAFIRTDVYGTYVLLESARASKGVERFLHVSTDEVYGQTDGPGFRETDPLNPRNPYAASKAGADRLAYAYHKTYGLPVNIVRPSNNFGPFQYPEKLIPVTIIRALKDEGIPVYGDGRQVRDWLYVDDTARAIDLVIQKGRPGEVYNIAGRNEKVNLDVVTRVLSNLDKDEGLIKFVKDRPGHDRRYALDDSRIREELGFTNSDTWESKMDAVVAWYVQNSDWWKRVIDHDREYREFMDAWYADR